MCFLHIPLRTMPMESSCIGDAKESSHRSKRVCFTQYWKRGKYSFIDLMSIIYNLYID